jgi:hypothetical protein
MVRVASCGPGSMYSPRIRLSSEPNITYNSSEAAEEAAGAPECEVEITISMLRAGYYAYAEWDPKIEEVEAMLAAVFWAMNRSG